MLENFKILNLNFEPLITHNISHSIQSMSTSTFLEWLVLEWNGIIQWTSNQQSTRMDLSNVNSNLLYLKIMESDISQKLF